MPHYTLCLKNRHWCCTLWLQRRPTPTDFSSNFWQRCCSEYAIERWFVILHHLTNVSALPGETWTPEIVFSVTVAKFLILQFAETTHIVVSKWNFALLVVFRFDFHQNRPSGFEAVGSKFALSHSCSRRLIQNRLVSDIAIFVLKRDVKLQLTN